MADQRKRSRKAAQKNRLVSAEDRRIAEVKDAIRMIKDIPVVSKFDVSVPLFELDQTNYTVRCTRCPNRYGQSLTTAESIDAHRRRKVHSGYETMMI